MKLIEAKNHLGVRFMVKNANGSYTVRTGGVIWVDMLGRQQVLNVAPPDETNIGLQQYGFNSLMDNTLDATIELHQPWLGEMITKRDELTKRIEQAQSAGKEMHGTL